MFFKSFRPGKIKTVRKNFYRTLTFYILLIATLPIFVVGTLSYIQVKKALDQEMGVWNAYVLENSKASFEIIVNQLFYQGSYLTTSSITSEYESVYNALAFESSSVNYLKQDLNGLNEYLFFKKNMIKLMSSLQMNNEYIDEIYYYDDEKDMILTSDGKQYNKHTFYDLAWYGHVKDSKNYFTRMDLRTVSQSGIDKDIVTLIYRTWNKSNAFIINVDVSKLYNSTIRNLSSHQNDYYIYSSEIDKSIGSGTGRTDRILSELGGIGVLIRNHPGNKLIHDRYLLTWVKSERLGWYFISVKDLSGYYANVAKARNLILLSSGMLLLLFVILSSVVSSRIYLPIKNLTKLIRSHFANHENQKIVDEIGYITRRFETVYHERFEIQSKFEENLPALRNMFKYDLIKHGLYSKAEIEDKLRDLEIGFPTGEMVVFLAQCDGGGSESQIRHVLEQLLAEKYPSFSVEIDNQSCFVVHMDPSQINQLYAVMQEAKERIKTASAVSSTVTIGVGNFVRHLSEVNESYRKAAEALKYRMVYGHDEIIFYEDIKISNKNSFSYPAEKEKALSDCILTGDLVGAQHILKLIIDEFTDPKHALSYRKLQKSVLMLLSGIMKTVDMLGIDMDDVLGRPDYFDSIVKNTNKRDLVNQCSNMLAKIMTYVSVEKTNKNNKDMDRILAFIEQNYNKDISLVDAAGVVGFNPSYVSRLIKSFTGKSFTDYVTERRIREAERLLLDTDLKLDDISREIGYNNTYYFIKVFRKIFGTTPNKYRNAHAASMDAEAHTAESEADATNRNRNEMRVGD